jgi:hypothetical protein
MGNYARFFERLIMVQTLLITLFAGILACILSACGVAYTPSPFGEGHVMLAGDAAGIRAFGDAANGLITNGKATADKDTAYWISRKQQEVEITRRTGVLDGLFGKPSETEVK